MRTFLAMLMLPAALMTSGSALADDAPTDPKQQVDGAADGASDKAAGDVKADTDPKDAASDTKTDDEKKDGEGVKKPPVAPLDEEEPGPKKPKGTEWFLGMRFRDFIVPKFIFKLFVEGGPSAVNIFTFGPEMTMRSGNLEVDFALSYSDFSMDEFMFRAKDDPDFAYEVISSDLKLMQFTVDLMGNIPLTKDNMFSILVGGGVGISGVFGNLYRSQAYPNDPNNLNPDDRNTWKKCDGVGDGPEAGQWCDNSNKHYPTGGKDYSEGYWGDDGGSKPIVFPQVNLIQLAFRVQPHEYFQVRADTGFAITGFFLGLAAGGKLPI